MGFAKAFGLMKFSWQARLLQVSEFFYMNMGSFYYITPTSKHDLHGVLWTVFPCPLHGRFLQPLACSGTLSSTQSINQYHGSSNFGQYYYSRSL